MFLYLEQDTTFKSWTAEISFYASR